MPNAWTLRLMDGPPFEAAYGTARSDTQGDCGDINNGFGLLFNWNLAGDGTNHRVRVLADGVEVASSTFAVTTLGLGQFPEGLNGTGTITNFPQSGRSTQLQWQESLQNFSITNPSGNSNGTGSNSPGVRLENPAPGSSQSGLGLISGWICEAKRVDIEIDGRATFRGRLWHSAERHPRRLWGYQQRLRAPVQLELARGWHEPSRTSVGRWG